MFISDRVVTSIEDVELIIENLKKFDVSFIFTQAKTSNEFNRTEITDFLTGIRRFFNFSKCEIPELQDQWEVAKYIYSKSSRFKRPPILNMKYVCLSPKEIHLDDIHLASAVDIGVSDLNDMSLFAQVRKPDFFGIKDIMMLYEKVVSGLEVSITLSKQPVPYPKDVNNKIKNGYYGLIRLDEYVDLLTDNVNENEF